MDERTSLIEPPEYFKPSAMPSSLLNTSEYEMQRKNSFMDSFKQTGNVFLVRKLESHQFSNLIIIHSNLEGVLHQLLMRFSNIMN